MAQIGIDVSKKKLDVCWLRDADTLKVKTRTFENSATGFQQLLTWLERQTKEPLEAQQVLMEATGVYHENLAYALYRARVQVHVANPAQAHQFSLSLGRRSKTDRRDSVTLARFLASRRHERWEPEPEEVRYLKALLARLHALDTDIQREHNRLESVQIQEVSGPVRDSVEHIIETLNKERERLRGEIDDHIDGNPHLKKDRGLLESIPGIGEVLSRELLAMLHSRAFQSARASAAFVGLVPIYHQSGTSVDGRPHLSKTGSARLRAKLYMAATVASRHNPTVRAHYERLLARGKSKMSALGAAMRKLVHIAYGVLKHQTSYRPQAAHIVA